MTTADGVALTHLDEPAYDDAGVTKGDLVRYLDAVADLILPQLRDRPLTVVRARPGTAPFVQKNLPRYAPAWIERLEVPAAGSGRTVLYPLCQDRRTLLWFANQRAVEFHPTVARGAAGEVTHLVLDLDPPAGAGAGTVAAAARLVRAALADAGLAGAPKTSGAKGLHVVVPVTPGVTVPDAAAATRALAARAAALDPDVATTAFLLADRGGRVYLDPTRAGGSSLAAAWSPRARPGLPVSFPVGWDDLDDVDPGRFTVRTVPALLDLLPDRSAERSPERAGSGRDPWRELLPPPQAVPADLVAEGHGIPVPRVAAMHEGRRRAAARRRAAGEA